ncbi:hypothetical protein ABZY05_47425 [Streptomyces canus]|uniref:glycine-rich domain-containing protein n=1 Tax=Streptomyces canus TaxID=58343 RepID=UPI0033AA6B5E
MIPIARACVCDDYFTLGSDGELCLKPGSMGLRQVISYGDVGTTTFRKASYPWLSRVRVRVQGAGGGSAGANADNNNEAIARPGGAGGAYGEGLIQVAALSATETIIVGEGGSAGGAGSDGGDGGSSQFGGHIFSPGGAGGTSNMPSGTTPSTSQGISGPVSGSGGDFRQGGGASGSALRLNGNVAMAGHGGNSFLGTGGLGRTTQGNGLGPRGRGAGAGGGLSFGGDVDGGRGGDGVVIVELYG